MRGTHETPASAARSAPPAADIPSTSDIGETDAPATAAAAALDTVRTNAEALAETVEAASARLRAGRTDQIGPDAAAISARAAALEDEAQARLSDLEGDAAAEAKATLTAPFERVQAAVEAHLRLVARLQGAARSLAEQAKREQVKRAGGGLYSAEGATAGRVATAGGRLLGQL